MIDIGSGNGLAPVWRQAIDDWLSIAPLETNVSDIWMKIQNFHSKAICNTKDPTLFFN